MVELDTLDIRTRKQWRTWLRKNHKSSPGVWVMCHKEHTGVPSIPSEDLVREALCFGWIDSLIKRLDDDRYARKVTPRKPTSKWSDLNRRRWAELDAAGLLEAAGKAAAPTENSYAPKPVIPELPAYIAKAFKANAKAWAFSRRCRPESAATSSSGSILRSVRRRANDAFAKRSVFSREPRSSA